MVWLNCCRQEHGILFVIFSEKTEYIVLFSAHHISSTLEPRNHLADDAQKASKSDPRPENVQPTTSMTLPERCWHLWCWCQTFGPTCYSLSGMSVESSTCLPQHFRITPILTMNAKVKGMSQPSWRLPPGPWVSKVPRLREAHSLLL